MKPLGVIVLPILLIAQEPNPTQQVNVNPAQPPAPGSAPIYRVNVLSRTTKAISYRPDGDSTKIGFQGTVLLPRAEGQARVKGHKGAFGIEAEFRGLEPPHRFGPNYLTYVLWAITPEGRSTNLGEVITDHENRGKLRTSTELQSFALILTAEPYFAATHPSDVVVLENTVLPGTRGNVQQVEAKYELLKRGEYTLDLQDARSRVAAADGPKLSLDRYEALLEVYQARNAVQLAAAQGAEEYAPEVLRKANAQLAEAERLFSHKAGRSLIVEAARGATQTAEDARLIALRRQRTDTLTPNAKLGTGQLP
jgi:hypothetical protein